MEGLPGDVRGNERVTTVRDYLVHVVRLVRTLFEGVLSRTGERAPSEGLRTGERGAPEAALEALTSLVHYGELATLAGIMLGVALLVVVLCSLGDYPRNIVVRFLDAVAANARRLSRAGSRAPGAAPHLAGDRPRARDDPGSDPVRPRGDARGFDVIDDYDCREWLLLNGAAASSVDSGYLRGLYGLAFAYEDGNFDKPRVSAGVALRGFLRAFFTYRGSIFWKMQGGMGDVVFAPFYEVLRRRGVRFAFFHRLENVRLADPARGAAGDTPHVEALEFDVQAEIRDGGTTSRSSR
jgi:uncharacterized protein with NAD-binding domain and iron-sulfur cluster